MLSPTKAKAIITTSKIRSFRSQTLAILTFAAAGMTVLLALLPDAGHDQLWLLLAAQRMGHSLNPYGPTIFESNPPLALWLSAIVVQLARALHLPLTVTFKLAVILAAAASASVSARLLDENNRHSGEVKISVFALFRPHLWLLAIAFLFIFGAIPARDFGQRDHILTLLILPYLVTASRVPHVRRELAPTMGILPRALITLIAALGLALKPHQALIPIAVELTLLATWAPHPRDARVGFHKGLRLLEPILFLFAAVAYIAAIRLFAPTYFMDVLPLLRDTYWAFGHLAILQLILAAPQLLILAALTVTLYVRKRPTHPLIPILLAAATAATLAYFLQGTGWYYQQLPALSLFALALALLTLNSQLLTLNSKIKPFLPSATAILTLLALTLTAYFSDFHLTPRGLEQSQPIPDPAFFSALPPNTPVATLTTSVDDTVPPAFRYHLTLAQRYPHLWMLPAILRNESGLKPHHSIPPDRLAQLDALQHRFMVEDLMRWHPTLILVERCQDPAVHCQVLEDRHDNLLAWFERDPAFVVIFARYHFQRSSGPYDAYILGTRDWGLEPRD